MRDIGPGARAPDELTFSQRMANLRHLGRLFAQIWRTSRFLTLASIGLRLVKALQPIAMLYVGKLIIDEVVRLSGIASPGEDVWAWWESGALSTITFYLGIELLLVLVNDLLTRSVNLVDTVLGEMHSNTVSVELLQHAARLDLMHFESADYQDRLERARRQAASRNTVLAQIFGQAQDIITVATLAAGLAVYAPWLIVLLFVSMFPAVWGEQRFNLRGYYLNRGRTPERRQLEYVRWVGARPETAKEVKLFGLGDFLVERFRTLATAIFLDNRKLAIERTVFGGILAAVSTLTYYGAYAYIVWKTISGDFSIGDLAFLSGSFLRLNGLFHQIMIGFTQVAGQSLYLDDLFSFFEIKPTILDPAKPQSFPDPLAKGIRFEKVGFRYPESETWTIRDLSFEIKAGETVALVGENGAGKTTIVKLMTRLYDPVEGRITIDGTDIRDIGLADLARHMGVIFQDFMRFSFTAGENIGIGDVTAVDDEARIREAAERSLAAAVIEKLPGRYTQVLGRMFSKGRDLSGGEWQKIAIARAYMRDAQVMILDEPTAALDAKAEAEVFARFIGLAQGKTTLLISHRFSTVRMADRILVLDNGRIIEDGSHAELVARGGLYAELFELQAAGYR
ncbi:ABC transporter ATP-binding protein [Devosia nitrariae]|uniref:ABC transporter ATP-binding protein n=1 Tax=Devosia nitrariae TaxID=2071872 RepID=A0ABQ5W4D4_9HYPH|nr:ABC transporter ATP-binding protein [Devosia nitrariae]GLQ54708.1 ABC transporter ATP-binding protein [Devosia nitrariae]